MLPAVPRGPWCFTVSVATAALSQLIAYQTYRHVSAIGQLKSIDTRRNPEAQKLQISTLKKIVEAMGGNIDIIASFDHGSVSLKQFDRSPKASTRRRRSLQTA